jgi:hypothetical protein
MGAGRSEINSIRFDSIPVEKVYWSKKEGRGVNFRYLHARCIPFGFLLIQTGIKLFDCHQILVACAFLYRPAMVPCWSTKFRPRNTIRRRRFLRERERDSPLGALVRKAKAALTGTVETIDHILNVFNFATTLPWTGRRRS